MYKTTDVASPEYLGHVLSVAPDCLEVFVQPGRMELSAEAVTTVGKFSRRSVHSPTHVRYGKTAESKNILEAVEKLYADIGAELVVIHPDLIDDVSVFDGSPMRLAVENMDNRKAAFRDVDSMRAFFDEHKDWGMVLDLNHCFTNDPTMKLAERFIEALGHKIAQIHLSGYAGFHEPLVETKQLEILNYCRGLNAPIVIESVMPRLEDLQNEYDYIVANLK